MGQNIRSCQELRVYKLAFKLAMQIFETSRCFPSEERFSLTDQIRRASRSVCANLAEAWRRRKYEAAFIAKLNDSETEAGEVQVWLEFCQACGYLSQEKTSTLINEYSVVISQIVHMREHPGDWLIRPKNLTPRSTKVPASARLRVSGSAASRENS